MLLGIFLAKAAFGQYDSVPQKQLETEIFRLTNLEREKRGLHKLIFVPELRELSRIQSYNMMKHVFFSHVDHKGRDPGRRKDVYFPKLLGGVGENIAYIKGIPLEKLAYEFIQLWMNSPGHRENVLRKEFGHLGIGVIEEGGVYYATQTFGELAARMISRSQRSYGFGSEQVFQFKFMGIFPKNELTVCMLFPDKESKFYVSENRYYTGVGIYQPEWQGNTFLIRVVFDRGRGRYDVQMGRNNAYQESGLSFLVK